jgi:hypothetical protein
VPRPVEDRGVVRVWLRLRRRSVEARRQRVEPCLGQIQSRRSVRARLAAVEPSRRSLRPLVGSSGGRSGSDGCAATAAPVVGSARAAIARPPVMHMPTTPTRGWSSEATLRTRAWSHSVIGLVAPSWNSAKSRRRHQSARAVPRSTCRSPGRPYSTGAWTRKPASTPARVTSCRRTTDGSPVPGARSSRRRRPVARRGHTGQLCHRRAQSAGPIAQRADRVCHQRRRLPSSLASSRSVSSARSGVDQPGS